jgi:hypothetical protein
MYQWIALLHVIAAFTFALAHGLSADVALKLRSELEIHGQALLGWRPTACTSDLRASSLA